ncbi:MAG: sugar-transfer associated ATP-grasp domain-containing protein [Desulfuromonadaceae bacterium]|nr:sugar-transfer associated ATP-grasp domain-containing protein [Desulfuromonadaceae bacterium]
MINKLIIYLTSLPTRVKNIRKLVNEGETYYPEVSKKNKLKIYSELFFWLLRHQEVNNFYFAYGLDCKSANIEDYISCGEFQKIRDLAQKSRYRALGNASYGCVLGDKFLFGKYLESINMPSPRVLGVGFSNHITLCESNSEIETRDLLSCEFDGFVKPLHAYGGKEIIELKIEDGKAVSGGLELTLDELLMKLPKAFMIQERFIQHDSLNNLFPKSVNTLRLVTYLENDKAQLFDGFLRAGVGDLCVDNWAAGGILGGIDMSTGRASKMWKYKPGFGASVTVHPDTKFILGDLEFPWFKESCDLVREIHQKYFYGFYSVGWDIAAGPEGPSIIEGNGAWSIEGFQTPYGGLKERVKKFF